MFLHKTLDLALVGKSYFSILLSIGLAARGQKVLLIDDDRVGLGPKLCGELSELERRFLVLWGRDLKINILQELGSEADCPYLRPCTRELIIDGRRVKLSGTPYQRFKQLCMKFPEIFFAEEVFHSIDEDNFNQEVEKMSWRFVDEAYRYNSMQYLDVNAFTNTMGTAFKNWFETIIPNYREVIGKSIPEVRSLRSFIYLGLGLTQSQLTDTVSDFEFYHFVLSLLLPHYNVKGERFHADLQYVFNHRSGQLKKAHIDDWQFENRHLTGVALNTYEGVIRPKRMFYMGARHSKTPFLLRGKLTLFTSTIFELEFENSMLSPWLGERHYIIGEQKVGTEVPFIELYFKIDKKIIAKFYYLHKNGSHPAFYTKEGLAWIKSALKENYPRLLNAEFNVIKVISETKDSIVHVKDYSKRRGQWLDLRKNFCEIIEYSTPNPGKQLKDVHYLGPEQGHALGPLGFLMDLKNTSIHYS